jgi:hypothetical protein
MERLLTDFEISALVHAIQRKSKFVGSGTLSGTYEFLYESNIIRPSTTTISISKFYNFFLTEYGSEYATAIMEYQNL